MTTYGSILICNDHINEVREFLKQFFDEHSDGYNYEIWRTFIVPGGFRINLLVDNEQLITQNMTFEIYCESLDELKSLADKYKQDIESFPSEDSPQTYTYYYFTVRGPESICKLEISYSEDTK